MLEYRVALLVIAALPVEVVRSDIVCEDEPDVRPAGRRDHAVGLERRVVVDDHVRRPIDELEQPPEPSPSWTTDIVEQVVLNQNALRLLARRVIVPAPEMQPIAGV